MALRVMVKRRKAALPIGQRLREMRVEKRLSQGDIEEKTGMLRCYISRVENGHTVPSLETLQRFASAFAVPLHVLFDAGHKADAKSPPTGSPALYAISNEEEKDARFLLKLGELQSRLSPEDQEVILALAKKMADEKSRARGSRLST